MDGRFDFFIGLVLGLLMGGLAIYAMVKIRGWFTSSELQQVRKENRQLQKRLEQKDRHIDEMLKRAEKVAQDMQKGRAGNDES
jgi:cell division protein ZapA (FtsZ GTPase activity inhibitor)